MSDHRRRWPSGIHSSSVTFHLLLYFLKSVHGSRRFVVVCIPPLCMDDALVFLAGSLPLHDRLILQSVSQTFSRILADELTAKSGNLFSTIIWFWAVMNGRSLCTVQIEDGR